jgi:hypothetical protein
MDLERRFSAHGHVIQLWVQITGSGWDIEEELDSEVVHVEHHDDWHRVERAVRLLEMKALGDADHADTAD